jgi:hypothetical protein
MNKIQHIEQLFKEASDFAKRETGAGLMKKKDGSFEDVIRKNALIILI